MGNNYVLYVEAPSTLSAPVIDSIVPGDGRLTVYYSHPDYEWVEFFNDGVSMGEYDNSADRIKVLTGLVNGVEYRISMRAYTDDGATVSSESNTYAETPVGIPGVLPAIGGGYPYAGYFSDLTDQPAPVIGLLPPTNFRTNGSPGPTSIPVAWDAPTQGDATGYLVKDDADDATVTGLIPWGTTSATVSNLDPSTSYTFYVVTTDGAAVSTASNTASNTTTALGANNYPDGLYNQGGGLFSIYRSFEGGTIGARANSSTVLTGWNYAGTDTLFSGSNNKFGSRSCDAFLPTGSFGETSRWNLESRIFPQRLVEGNEIWFRVWIYLPQDFVWAPERNSTKFIRIWTSDANGANKRYINIYNQKNNLLVENWAADGGVDGFYATWGINPFSPAADFFKSYPRLGFNSQGQYIGWECIELYVKFGRPGIVRCYRNGVRWFNDPLNATARPNGGYADQASIFGHYSNTGNESPSPKDQHVYVDDTIITTITPNETDSYGGPIIGTAVGR